MSFFLLPNSAGNLASSLDKAGATPNLDSAYDPYNLIGGPRSTFGRTAASTLARRFGYHFAADFTPTHAVVARADWLLSLNTANLQLINKSSGGVWSAVAGNISPLATANLVGQTTQDYCVAFTPTQLRGFGVESAQLGASAEALQLSKLYFSTGFDFGKTPSMLSVPQWQVLPPGANFIIPKMGFEAYEIEARLTLTWLGITRAKAEAFKAIPQILAWPIFLFDDAAYIWPWKLEHVLVEDYVETVQDDDIHDISITFARLKHYE